MAAGSMLGAASLLMPLRDIAADKAITGVLTENKAVSAVGNHFKYEPIFLEDLALN